MKVLKRFSNGEKSVSVMVKDDGKVYSSDGTYICDYDDEDLEDKIEEYGDDWRETHWSMKDYADYYGCNESELE